MTYPKYEEEVKAISTLMALAEMCLDMSMDRINPEIVKTKVFEYNEYAENRFTEKTPPKTMLCAVAICTACDDIAEKVDWNNINKNFWHRLACKIWDNYGDIQERTRSIVEKGPKSTGYINIDEIHEIYRLGE